MLSAFFFPTYLFCSVDKFCLLANDAEAITTLSSTGNTVTENPIENRELSNSNCSLEDGLKKKI